MQKAVEMLQIQTKLASNAQNSRALWIFARGGKVLADVSKSEFGKISNMFWTPKSIKSVSKWALMSAKMLRISPKQICLFSTKILQISAPNSDLETSAPESTLGGPDVSEIRFCMIWRCVFHVFAGIENVRKWSRNSFPNLKTLQKHKTHHFVRKPAR